MRRWALVLVATVFVGCNTTSAVVTPCAEGVTPGPMAQVIEVVQDPGDCPAHQVVGHIRAGGNTRAWEAMERVKTEAQRLGADAITNVHRVTGTDEAIYEADAIQWLPR